MSRHEFHIALSHAILAGSSIYCLIQIKNVELFCPHVTYSIVAANSLLGVAWWLMDYNSRLNEVARFTSYCQLLFALPCITTTVWLQNGYPKEWSWAWATVPIFPLMCYMVQADLETPLADLLILFNLVGLGVVSFVKELAYGTAATIAYAVAHTCGRVSDIRRAALYNYVMCFFVYFSLRAVGYGKDIFS